jgi:hypothetical protein
MPVDHLTAHGLMVGWFSIDTFPQDGRVVEVIDVNEFVCKAQWHSGRILTASLSAGKLKGWRDLG